MSDIGDSLRTARVAAGIHSLSGMATRTGYSRSYLGNVETGKKLATADVIAAYERVLGDSVLRRELLAGAIAAVVCADGDIAADMVRDIMGQRSRLLASAQTSHATDRSIGALIAQRRPCVGSLAKWMRSGPVVLRVNAAGILAKTGLAEPADMIARHLTADVDTRKLYLTAVVARVLEMPWDDAGHTAGLARFDEQQVSRLAVESTNKYDVGARWCAVHLLAKAHGEHRQAVDLALRQALANEPSREMLRHIGLALVGDPTFPSR